MASKDFNYQVALKEGLKSLEQGRLRQAEQSFKYLVDKFPGAEGGYRGLAKVHFEEEDRAGALRVLRDGAAALTKSGERSAAIGLLRQAIVLDPRDLSTHRRLAAGLALAGDTDAAVQEYARFIRDLRDSGATERAKGEVAYAKGQLRGVSGVSTLDAIANGEPAAADAAESEAPTEKTTRFSEREAGSALRPRASDQWSAPRAISEQAFAPPPAPSAATTADDPWAAPPPTTYPRGTTSDQQRQGREITLENDPWATISPPSAPSWPPREEPATEQPSEEAAAEPEAPPAEPVEAEPMEAQTEERWVPEPEPAEANGEPAVEADPIAIEADAARYLGTRDPRAAGKALEAARYYVKEGRLDAASDLLLQLIAAGVADHDAQRLLVDIVRTLGKREVAKTKCQLLAHALLLDGRNDLAAEVEALALAD
ncbi:MAG TPA: bacterial transcriptional activator domain-containing protein [Verrucomicrobiae bacterium]|nr:bacterial transcriptional activator domain-containing protein [Verrucomicrobiae bacterium]